MTEVIEMRMLQTLVDLCLLVDKQACVHAGTELLIFCTHTMYLHYFNLVTNCRQCNGEKGAETLFFLLNQTLDLVAKTCESARGYLFRLSPLPSPTSLGPLQSCPGANLPTASRPQQHSGKRPSLVSELFCLPVTTQPQKAE